MNVRITLRRYGMLAAMVLAAHAHAQDGAGAAGSDEWIPKIGQVFFAQQHVQEPADPLFKLVGNLAALIKIQVYSDMPRQAPDVVVMLDVGGQSHEFTLRGPRMLPKPYPGEPKLMPHSYDDSYTGIIPREWIKPGLKVAVELRAYSYPNKFNPPGNTGMTVFDRREFENLRVGAPSKMLMTSFDIHFFQEEEGADFPRGWEIALADKLPVAELEVQRVRHIVFDDVVMPNCMRVGSAKEYEERTGQPFDSESKAARRWMVALKQAGGRNYDHSVLFLNLAGVEANGWGDKERLAGTTDLGRMGNFVHEMGHVYGLPHWDESKNYPYKGDMLGIRADKENVPHVGPTWAYSLHRRAFISPLSGGEDPAREQVGPWRRDPMYGGGHGEPVNYMIRHFSDYSVRQMQDFIEKRVLFWDETQKAYFRWNDETLSYSTPVESDGWNLATDPFAEVISVIASASAVAPEANYIYPPIGPYQAGLLHRFDANSAEDRERAKTFGFSDATCDVCLRVTQGGKTTTYLLEAKLDPDANPARGGYVVTAINLPAQDGKLTRMELLHTPDVISKGIPADAKVLYHWPAKPSE